MQPWAWIGSLIESNDSESLPAALRELSAVDLSRAMNTDPILSSGLGVSDGIDDGGGPGAGSPRPGGRDR